MRGGDGVDRRRAVRIGPAVALAGAVILAGAGPAPTDPQTDTPVDRELAQARAVYESASAQAQSALTAYNETTRRLAVAQDAADQRPVDAAKPSPSDLADRLGLVVRVARRERQALNGYLDARVTAEEADNAALVVGKAADDAAGRARRALSAARVAAGAARQAADEAAALRATQAAATAATNAQRDATLAQYRELQASSDQLAAELRRLADQRRTAIAVAPGAGGYFLTPVRGRRSSDFGMRYDPYYRVWQLHAGIDLAAPGGTPIYAAAGGQVVRAGRNGGNGNYTCISHGLYQGQNLSTCYAHQSAILVTVGHLVQRGQLIGRVGTTGASTGDHLHFEVRLNGTPVQPLNWLDACLC
jgi:murein DD-endopeptidase MepM/ murein hydrolase activator NlpD